MSRITVMQYPYASQRAVLKHVLEGFLSFLKAILGESYYLLKACLRDSYYLFFVLFKAVLRVGAQAISLLKGVLRGKLGNCQGAFWEQ